MDGGQLGPEEGWNNLGLIFVTGARYKRHVNKHRRKHRVMKFVRVDGSYQLGGIWATWHSQILNTGFVPQLSSLKYMCVLGWNFSKFAWIHRSPVFRQLLKVGNRNTVQAFCRNCFGQLSSSPNLVWSHGKKYTCTLSRNFSKSAWIHRWQHSLQCSDDSWKSATATLYKHPLGTVLVTFHGPKMMSYRAPIEPSEQRKLPGAKSGL